MGAVVAAYVAVEWVTLGISHEVLAVASAFAIIVGVQLVMFGVLSDMILAINREQTRRFEQLVGHRSDHPADGSRGPADGNVSATWPVAERERTREDRRRQARNDGVESETVETGTDGEQLTD